MMADGAAKLAAVDQGTAHARLMQMAMENELEIGVDLKRLNRPESPVFSRADNLWPLAVPLGLALVGWIWGGWMWALAGLASGIILFLTTINLIVMQRLRRRAMIHAKRDAASWQRLWALGGLSLRLTGAPASEERAPETDWTTYLARHGVT